MFRVTTLDPENAPRLENGQVDWHAIVRDFYGPFEKDLEKGFDYRRITLERGGVL